jgi:Protein of unknown function (DUF3179)
VTTLSLVAGLLLAACGVGVPSGGQPEEVTGIEAPGSYSEVVTPPPGDPLPDDRVAEILAILLEIEPDGQELRRALEEIEDNRDTRFIAPLIEIMRAGPARTAIWNAGYGDVLREISGVIFATDWVNWGRWVEWYGNTTLTPPPGFTAWKGELFANVDERFKDFLYEGVASAIPIEQIAWGGILVDGIRPLDNPPVLSAADATYLDPAEPVFGVVVNGEARAYPLRIMDPHELANDVLGGIPIALAYCTLCGSGIAYDARAADGGVYTFGTSGLLYQSNKLMYDRQTGTLWNQFTGRPVVGPLVASARQTSGSLLRMLPLVLSSWESWLAQHPDTTVLDINTGIGFGYQLGYPYLEYFSSGETMFPVAQRSAELSPKQWVFGLNLAGEQKAYSLDALIAGGEVVNDSVGGTDVAVISSGALIDVEAEAPGFGLLLYQAGGEVRAFERPDGLTFRFTDEPGVFVDSAGKRWTLTEEALVAGDGSLAPRIVGHTSFWFGWFQFFPHTELYGGRGP